MDYNDKSSSNNDKGSFWPALAGIIVAITGLITVLHSTGIIGAKEVSSQDEILTTVTSPGSKQMKKGKLVVEDLVSKIEVRKGPGKNYGTLHYGIGGDEVTLVDSATSSDGFDHIWYKVKFTGSGAEGWVRSDLIQWL